MLESAVRDEMHYIGSHRSHLSRRDRTRWFEGIAADKFYALTSLDCTNRTGGKQVQMARVLHESDWW